jgi:hypothetical protein
MPSDRGKAPIKACRLDDRGYQRAHPRFDIKIDAKLAIAIPEDSSEPSKFEARTEDVSARGMRIVVDRLPSALYTKLLSRTRQAAVEFDSPASTGIIKVRGRIAWMDYRKTQSRDEAAPCQLGIAFDSESDPELTDYLDFILNIEAA